jgi:hypothetical protein
MVSQYFMRRAFLTDCSAPLAVPTCSIQVVIAGGEIYTG